MSVHRRLDAYGTTSKCGQCFGDNGKSPRYFFCCSDRYRPFRLSADVKFSSLRIKIYSKWQEYFSQSAQRSQRKSKTLAFISKQKASPAFPGVLCELASRCLLLVARDAFRFTFSSGLSGLDYKRKGRRDVHLRPSCRLEAPVFAPCLRVR